MVVVTNICNGHINVPPSTLESLLTFHFIELRYTQPCPNPCSDACINPIEQISLRTDYWRSAQTFELKRMLSVHIRQSSFVVMQIPGGKRRNCTLNRGVVEFWLVVFAPSQYSTTQSRLFQVTRQCTPKSPFSLWLFVHGSGTLPYFIQCETAQPQMRQPDLEIPQETVSVSLRFRYQYLLGLYFVLQPHLQSNESKIELHVRHYQNTANFPLDTISLVAFNQRRSRV